MSQNTHVVHKGAEHGGSRKITPKNEIQISMSPRRTRGSPLLVLGGVCVVVRVTLTCSRRACSGGEEGLWKEGGERLVEEGLRAGGHPARRTHERNGRQKLHSTAGLVKL